MSSHAEASRVTGWAHRVGGGEASLAATILVERVVLFPADFALTLRSIDLRPKRA
jgi:hypothetical protein